MDQAEKLRNVIKLKNQKLPQKARVITVTSGIYLQFPSNRGIL